jgi:hypothetical protein
MNKKNFFLILTLLIGLALAAAAALGAARSGNAQLWLSPETTTAGPGETVFMSVQLESASLVSGVDLSLTYDPAVLLVLDADPNEDGVQITPGTCPEPEFFIYNEANVISGTIQYAVVDLGVDAGCTSGEVAQIDFQCIGLGTSDVSFSPETEISDPEGITITLTTQNAAITCTDVTSTPGPSATPTQKLSTATATQTATATPTPTPPDHYLPIVRNDVMPTPTPTPTSTPSWTVILNETFEGDFPGVWQLFSIGSSFDYQWGKRNCQVFEGSFSGWGVGGGPSGSNLGCNSPYPNNVEAWMVYGPFSLEGMTAADMTLKAWVNTESNFDFLCRFVSTVGGTQVGDYDGWCTHGNSQGWVDRALNFADVTEDGGSVNLLGDPSVWVAFVFYSDSEITFPEGGFVDNVLIRRCASNCVSNLNYTGPTNALVQDVPSAEVNFGKPK